MGKRDGLALEEVDQCPSDQIMTQRGKQWAGGGVHGVPGHLIVLPNVGAVGRIMAYSGQGRGTIDRHRPCFDNSSGLSKLKCSPVAVEGMWLRRWPFLEGGKAQVTVSSDLKGGDLAKEEASGDSVHDWQRRRGRRANNRMCWNVGPQLGGRFRRRNSQKTRITVRSLEKKNKERNKEMRRRRERGLFPDKGCDVVERVAK
jgi:hypothetical protein